MYIHMCYKYYLIVRYRVCYTGVRHALQAFSLILGASLRRSSSRIRLGYPLAPRCRELSRQRFFSLYHSLSLFRSLFLGILLIEERPRPVDVTAGEPDVLCAIVNKRLTVKYTVRMRTANRDSAVEDVQSEYWWIYIRPCTHVRVLCIMYFV